MLYCQCVDFYALVQEKVNLVTEANAKVSSAALGSVPGMASYTQSLVKYWEMPMKALN